jgi:hypothetical protein
MDRVQLVLLGLPILLFCSDLVTLFAPQPPSAPQPNHSQRPASDGALPDDPPAADASVQVLTVTVSSLRPVAELTPDLTQNEANHVLCS